MFSGLHGWLKCHLFNNYQPFKMPNELNKKGEYYRGYLMPEKFSRWLDSCPLNWQMVSIGKDRGTYMFFVEDSE